MNKMITASVYSIVNLANEKEYIGSTFHFTKRINAHFSLLKRGKHYNKAFQKDYNRYGESVFLSVEWQTYQTYSKRWAEHTIRFLESDYLHASENSYNEFFNHDLRLTLKRFISEDDYKVIEDLTLQGVGAYKISQKLNMPIKFVNSFVKQIKAGKKLMHEN